MKEVIIYTDGACKGNPGPGGYGAVLIYKNHRKEISGGDKQTTNNRMEMMAAIAALETLTMPCEVTLFSDSSYLVNAITKGWAVKWKSNNWMRTKKDPALNSDLWERLLSAIERHEVIFCWVRGHTGHTENERCDQLACSEAEKIGRHK